MPFMRLLDKLARASPTRTLLILASLALVALIASVLVGPSGTARAASIAPVDHTPAVVEMVAAVPDIGVNDVSVTSDVAITPDNSDGTTVSTAGYIDDSALPAWIIGLAIPLLAIVVTALTIAVRNLGATRVLQIATGIGGSLSGHLRGLTSTMVQLCNTTWPSSRARDGPLLTEAKPGRDATGNNYDGDTFTSGSRYTTMKGGRVALNP